MQPPLSGSTSAHGSVEPSSSALRTQAASSGEAGLSAQTEVSGWWCGERVWMVWGVCPKEGAEGRRKEQGSCREAPPSFPNTSPPPAPQLAGSRPSVELGCRPYSPLCWAAQHLQERGAGDVAPERSSPGTGEQQAGRRTQQQHSGSLHARHGAWGRLMNSLHAPAGHGNFAEALGERSGGSVGS